MIVFVYCKNVEDSQLESAKKGVTSSMVTLIAASPKNCVEIFLWKGNLSFEYDGTNAPRSSRIAFRLLFAIAYWRAHWGLPMSTMISVSIWLRVSSALCACYCPGRHYVLKSRLMSEYARIISSGFHNQFHAYLCAARNRINVLESQSVCY